MNENGTENVNNSNKKIDRVAMNLRLPFQKLVFQKLGIEHDPDKVLLDGKIISDYIDDTDNAIVRELIMTERYEEAAEIVLKEIDRVEHLGRAA